VNKIKIFLIQSIVFSDIKIQWVHFGPLVLTTPVTVARLTLHKLYMDLSDRWKNNIIILNIFLINIILRVIIVYLCLRITDNNISGRRQLFGMVICILFLWIGRV
jgi:hypothetical protein